MMRLKYQSLMIKMYHAKHNVTALKHLPYSPDLSPPDFFLFLRLKSVPKGQRSASAKKVSAKATSTDGGIKKWFLGMS
jgi:hypothetical protein